jgi:carboxypeptidase Q
MKRFFIATLAIALVLLFANSGLAQKRGPSTAQERETAVKVARLLETDPFHKDAKKMREWFIVWISDVPDISVELCSAYTPPEKSTDKNYGSEIFVQTMFSSAAYIIEHPDQANDRVAVHLAGVEGSLKVYETVLVAKPKAKSEFYDQLLERRNKGELRAFVEEATNTKCKSKA